MHQEPALAEAIRNFLVQFNVVATILIALCFTHGIVGRREGRIVVAPGAWADGRGFERPVLEYRYGWVASGLFVFAFIAILISDGFRSYSFLSFIFQPLTLNAIVGRHFARKNRETVQRLLTMKTSGKGGWSSTVWLDGGVLLLCLLLFEVLK